MLDGGDEMPDEINAALLKEGVEEFEADIIEALLKSAGIPVLKKSRLGGGYMGIVTGVNHLGIDMYVPTEMLEDAKLLLEAEIYDISDDTEAGDDEINMDTNDDVQQNYESRRLTGINIVRAIIMAGIIFALYMVLKSV